MYWFERLCTIWEAAKSTFSKALLSGASLFGWSDGETLTLGEAAEFEDLERQLKGRGSFFIVGW